MLSQADTFKHYEQYASKDTSETIISYTCLVANMAIGVCWTASQTWVAESYPTVTRSLGYGFANMTSRIGAILAPFAINLEQLPLLAFVTMGFITLISTVLTYFWPETCNKTMAETMYERKAKTCDLGVEDGLDPHNLYNPSDRQLGINSDDGIDDIDVTVLNKVASNTSSITA
ncbi:solute carrier family 22 member 15-like protein [Elysia marginata]|uniref:Solute carrier family 22 member 15-like protein n=1 Tax=Elysia marginata TaxID=1093978 RepID=A0AAV4I975_9GAST|nr:solute carrier family 22 member 15-like protein [Elysia marginata]